MSVTFDPWQEQACRIALGLRPDDTYAATVGGNVWSIPRQIGKALDVNTPMLTANRGWTTMGDLRAGDYVFGSNGEPTRITEAHPIRVNRECFLVRTTDGREVVADSEHLWTVVDRRAEVSRGPISSRTRWHESRTLTTRQLLDAGLHRSIRANGRNEWRFQLPRQGAVKGQRVDLPVDPYLLGAWLGDGTSANGTFTVHHDDLGHLVEQVKAAGYAPRTWECRTGWMVRASAPAGGRRQADSLAGHLRRLGVLGRKHVPDLYLTGSAQQRESLLQGLMDTDGSISASGRCEFTSTTRDLADAVLFLVRSLGWRAAIRESDAKLAGRVVGRRWRVVFTPKTHDEFTPFRLPRKVERIARSADTHGRHTVSICAIQPVPSRPVRCIAVDAPDSLFLAGRDLIVTHNTFTLGSLMIAMCIEYPNLRVVWTSHHLRTTTNTFRSLQSLVRRRGVYSHLRRTSRSEGIRTANGEQEINFNNGSIIMFGARAEGFGRGIDAVDIIVFDEAQILNERALDDMIATTMQAKHEHGALLFYIGTPPRPVDDGEAFTNKRKRALAGDTKDQMYLEFGADPGADPDDQSQWARANPSYPVRTPLASMKRLRENLASDESWLREGLGVWDEEEPEPEDDGPEPALDPEYWAACGGGIPDSYDIESIGVAVSFGGKFSSVVLGAQAGKKVLPLPTLHGGGTSWVIDEALDLARRYRVPVLLDKGGPAGFLAPELEKQARYKGVKVKLLGFSQVADAAALLDQHVSSGKLLHGWIDDGAPEEGPWWLLHKSVQDATRRTSGDRWLWGRKSARKGGAAPDITTLEAATVALWGVGNKPAKSAVEANLEAGRPAVLTI